MRRIASIAMVVAVAASTMAPSNAAVVSETAVGFTSPPAAPTSLLVDDNGTLTWTPPGGPVNSQTIRWQDTRIPSGWLEAEQEGTPLSNLSPQVVGGETVGIRNHRYGTFIVGFDANDDPVLQCGGVLIHPEWMLTAAHCAEYQPTGTHYTSPNYFSVVYGLSDWTDFEGRRDTSIQYSDEIYIHPGYDRNEVVNDIALIHLEAPVDPAKAAFIPLYDLGGPADEATAFVTGWGATVDHNGPFPDTVHGIEVEVDESCGDWPTADPDSWDDDAYLCATGYPGGPCVGDSGGPLVVNRSGVILLVGLVSFGPDEGCAYSPAVPDVYTRVSSYIEWIETMTGPLGGSRTVDGSVSSTTLDGLRPGRTYAVAVRAENDGGATGAIAPFTMPGQFMFTSDELGVDCDQNLSQPFFDVAFTSFARSSIGCIFRLGVTTGTSPISYSPANVVTREQMAAFIARLYQRLTGEACGGSHPFTDVPASSFANPSIACIYNLGITTGTSRFTYGPSQPVSRAQMAAFIARLYQRLTGEACGGSHPFTDVPASSFANPSIACIYNLGVTTGTSASTYGPDEHVTREQMAAFVARLYRIVSA